jgi:hypothetical protein
VFDIEGLKAQWYMNGSRRVFNPTRMPFLGLENERRVWDHIKHVLVGHLEAFDSTIAEDEEILKNTNLTFNERNCVLYRKGEKQTALYLVNLAEWVS